MRRLILLSLSLSLSLPATALAGTDDLVISELHIKAPGAAEWIELYNPGADAVALDGCTLDEGGDTAALDGITAEAGAWLLLTRGGACAVFDSSGACSRPPDGGYEDLVLNDTSAETLELRCAGALVDAVVYDWSALSGDCPAGAQCSANLDPGSLDATANDDWGQWCVPPATSFAYDELNRELVATPGATNVCADVGPPCGPGDLIFTELMVAPASTNAEWIELLSLGGDGCDLQGCKLQEGPFEDPLHDITNPDWTSHVIDADSNTLPVTLGERLLLARGQATVATDGPDGAVLADYSYGSISMGNSDAGWLHLLCDGQVVDSVPYDWAALEGSCPGRTCSAELPAEGESPASNDTLDAWCVPPEEPVYTAPDGSSFGGSPGGQGVCQRRAWPGAGDLLFTELQVHPQSSDDDSFPEWVELLNIGGAAYDLAGCSLQTVRMRDDGVEDEVTRDQWMLGSDGSLPVIDVDAVLVLSRDLCVDGTEALGGICEGGFTYGGLSFSNSEHEHVGLYCPDGAGGDVLVDKAGFDVTRQGTRDGHSHQFDPDESDPLNANDDPQQWCEAPFDACYGSNSDGECNYGSPGAVGRCATGAVDLPPDGPGVACSATGVRAWSWGALLLLGAALARRRS